MVDTSLLTFPGFVTNPEFHLYRSGALVALETFGAMAIVPGLAVWVLAGSEKFLGRCRAVAQEEEERKNAVAAIHIQCVTGSDSSLQQPLRPNSGLLALHSIPIFSLMRSCTAFCAMLSAAIQRRHLYAWSLFAPRFAFEACFLIVADISFILFMHVWAGLC